MSSSYRPHYGAAHQKARAELLADDPLCAHCGLETATVADHQPPVAMHDHVEDSGCCSYVPSCKRCSSRQAGEVSNAVAVNRGQLAEVTFDEPEPTPGPSDPIWAVPWLSDLIEPPSGATWPRWMSAPHPDAIGSLGHEFEAYVLERRGVELRHFQRLAARRILEVDREGRLVWLQWFVTVARQVGKTVLIVELLVWALAHVRDHWSADDVVLCSRQLKSAESAIKDEIRWALETDRWHAHRVNGQKKIMLDERFELLCLAAEAVYGETAGLLVIDESWDVASTTVAESIEPAILAAEGQIGYTSTAHRKATSLSLNLRKRAFEQLDEPDDLLLIEWSADRSLAVDDREGWRQASPHWSRHREKLIARRLEAALSGEVLDPTEPDPLKAFEAQYLNRWPVKQTRRGPGEPLFEVGSWAAALHTSELPTFGRVMAVEDNYGHGLAVVIAGVTAEERIGLVGREFEDVAAGWAYAVEEAKTVGTILVGGTLLADANRAGLTSIEPAGRIQTRTGLSTLRSTMHSGDLVHDGSPDLAAQMIECRIRANPTGLSIASPGRHDLVNASAWAAARVQAERSITPGVW